MVDSNEKLQSQLNETPETVFREKPQDEASEIENKELNKRALVEQAIEEHPIFQAMQRAIMNTNVTIMIEAIVDRYFDLTTDNNVLDNLQYYEVNDDTIRMTLQQTAYLLSVEENGIVLEENGEIDEEATNRQRRMAVYSEQLKQDLLPEERKDIYINILDNMQEKDVRRAEQIFKAYSSRSFSRADDLLLNLMNQEVPLEKEEWKQVSKKMVEDKNVQESQEISKDKLFFNTKKDYFITLSALKYASTLYSNKPDPEKLAKFLQEVKELDTNGDFVDPETGEISSDKVLEVAETYHAEYTKRSNYKELLEYTQSTTDFDQMDPNMQRNLLSSIYSLYKMPQCHERAWALIAMQSISPDSIDKVGRVTLIKEDVFLKLYNATTRKSNITIEEMESEISKRDIGLTLKHMQSIKKLIKQGKFTDLEIPPEATPEEEKRLRKELRKEINSSERPKFKQSDSEALEKAIDKIIKDEKIQGNREELVIAAYRLMQRRAKNDEHSHYVADSEYLKSHIEGTARVYGNYLNQNQITRKALDLKGTPSTDIEKLAKGIIQFRNREEMLKAKKFSFEHMKEDFKNSVKYFKAGAQYLGNQTKNLFISMFNNKPLLPEGKVFVGATRDSDAASIDEIKIMSEQLAEVKAKEDAEKKAAKEAEKIAQKEAKAREAARKKAEKELEKRAQREAKAKEEAKKKAVREAKKTSSKTQEVVGEARHIITPTQYDFARVYDPKVHEGLNQVSRAAREHQQRAPYSEMNAELQQRKNAGGER